jgi:hypothetical protein
MGAGTYTGIEAVSNGIAILKEPRVCHRQAHDALHAVSLAFTAGGIHPCYLLFSIHPVEGKTMNAVLVDTFIGGWSPLGMPLGRVFVVLTLTSEAILPVRRGRGRVHGRTPRDVEHGGRLMAAPPLRGTVRPADDARRRWC